MVIKIKGFLAFFVLENEKCAACYNEAKSVAQIQQS